MASAAPDRQILGLDLIRFGAATLVMLFHLVFASWAIPRSAVREIAGGAVAFPALAPISWFGWVGVEIFFVLSGLVICLSAQEATAFGFARSRIVRLYPAAWVCGTLTLAVLLLLGQDDLPMRYARTISLYPAGPWVAAVYWTLVHEMAFYGLIFLLLLVGKVRYLPHLLSALGLASTAFLVLLVLNQKGGLDPTLHVLLVLGLGIPAKFVLNFGCFFALGGLIFLCASRQVTAWRLAMIVLCGGGSLLRIVWRTGGMSRAAQVPLDPAMPCAIFAVAVLLMTASLVWHEPIRRRFGGQAARLREIGLATYPLYLLHAPLGAAILLGLRQLGVGQELALAAAIAAVVTLAFLVSRFIERPIQRGLRQYADVGRHGAGRAAGVDAEAARLNGASIIQACTAGPAALVRSRTPCRRPHPCRSGRRSPRPQSPRGADGSRPNLDDSLPEK